MCWVIVIITVSVHEKIKGRVQNNGPRLSTRCEYDWEGKAKPPPRIHKLTIEESWRFPFTLTKKKKDVRS
jgi:hypothetical protein